MSNLQDFFGESTDGAVSITNTVSASAVFVNTTGQIHLVGAATGGTVTAFLPQNNGTLLTNINVSASNASANLSNIAFSNSNGMAFGLNGSTLTASYTVPAVTNSSWTVSDNATSGTVGRLAFTNLNNVTLSLSTGAGGSHTIVGSIPAQTNQTAGVYASSQTYGQSSSSTYDARSLSVVGSGGVSVGWSNSSLLISGQTTTPQTNQTAGIYASSQTFGQSSSSTYDARSLSVVGSGGVSVGWSNSTLLISGQTTTPQTAQTVGLYASSQTTAQSSSSTVDARSISIVGQGNISVGLSAGSFIISQTGGGGGGGFTGGVSNIGNTVGNTGTQTGTFVLAGGNNVTLSVATAAGGAQTITISGPNTVAQTNQSLGIYGSSQTTGQSSSSTYDARSLTMVFSNNISGGWTNGSLLFNVTTAAQTNQTGGIYVTAQSTGQSSSSTYDVRTLSFVPDGIISAGWSNGSFRVSATQSNQAFSAAGGSSAFQTLGFSDNANASWTNTNGSVAIQSVRASLFATSNTTQSSTGTVNLNSIIFAGAGIASVGITNGSVVVSVPSGGGAGDGGVFAGVSTAGNTAGSTGTVSTGNFVLVGSGPISLSQSTGAAGSAATITINAPATSSLVGTNGISISTNGSTISISAQLQTISWYEPEVYGGTTTTTPSNGTVYFRPFRVGDYANFNRVQLLQQMASQSATTMRFTASVSAGNATSGTASYGLSGTMLLYSRVSTGTAANSSQIISFTSQTYSHGVGISESVSWSTNASSATASWTTSQAISFISSINSTGGFTTGSSGTSGSSTFSSTSTNANSFSSTFTASFMSQHLSQVRPIIVPMGTTLTPGEYWLAIIQSTNTGSTNYSHQSVVMPASVGLVYYTSNSTGYAEIGNSATIASSNLRQGIGSYSASSQTTTSIPLSQISNTTGQFGNASLYFNAAGWIK